MSAPAAAGRRRSRPASMGCASWRWPTPYTGRPVRAVGPRRRPSRAGMSEFGRYASYYDDIYAGQSLRAANVTSSSRLVGHAIGSGPWRVLDAGCGTGHHTLALAGSRPPRHRSRPLWSMLDVARGKSARGVHFLAGDVRALDLGETFDLVTCLFAVLGYQLAPHDRAALAVFPRAPARRRRARLRLLARARRLHRRPERKEKTATSGPATGRTYCYAARRRPNRADQLDPLHRQGLRSGDDQVDEAGGGSHRPLLLIRAK